MSDAARNVRSTVTDKGQVVLSIEPLDLGSPAPNQVLIRVEAAPINPSDLGMMLAGADPETATEIDGAVSLTLSPAALAASKARVGKSMPVGNEGAGIVVEAGRSAGAQALLGRTVAVLAGGMYGTHRMVDAEQCLLLAEGTDPADAASCFVNPLTALGMTETMRREGHTAIIHTAAASNLGQMLNRICLADGIPLVNIVRREEQAQLLSGQGATHVVDSSTPEFVADLTAALVETGATIAFDAIGGGELGSKILQAMEAAATADGIEFNRYGSTIHKQLYIYGGLDRSATIVHRTFGMAWSMGGWLLPPFLESIGPDRTDQLRQRVADELTTTFASTYSATISLEEMLEIDRMRDYARMATGEKVLVTPHT